MIDDREIDDSDSPVEIGFSGLPDSSDPSQYTLELTDLINQIDSHVQIAHDAIRQLVLDCINNCNAITGDCQDCIAGGVLRYIDGAEKLIKKIHDKYVSAATATIVDSSKHIDNVDGIANYIFGASDTISTDESIGMDTATLDDLQRIATQRGQIYNSGQSATDTTIYTNPDTGVDTIPINVNQSDTSNGRNQPSSDCKCPDGYELVLVGDDTNGFYYACKHKLLGNIVPCISPPPPPPPGKCIEIANIFPACDTPPTFCINGVPATHDDIVEYAKLCCLGNLPALAGQDCEVILKCILDNSCDNPPPPPPKTSDDTFTTTCEYNTPDEILDDVLDYESGSLNSKGQELSTESDPIEFIDADTNETVTIKVGSPDPRETVVTPPELTSEQLIQTALRNDGKLPSCELGTPRINGLTSPNKVGQFNYCKLDSHKGIQGVLDEYYHVAERFANSNDGGVISGTNALYDLLAGGQTDLSYVDKTLLTGQAAVMGYSFGKTVLKQKLTQNLQLYPDGCHFTTTVLAYLFQEIEGAIKSGNNEVPPSVLRSFYYIQNYACQYLLPGVDDFDNMYIRGRIDDKQWEYGQKVHGYCVEWKKKVVESQRPQIPFSVVYGWCRAGLIDEEEKTNLLKYVGIEGDTAKDNFETFSEYLPGPSDLVRMMVRDVFDSNIVEKYKYAEDFDKKYTDKAKELFARQNITEDTAKLFWYQHWQLPSPVQAYTMVWRLRPEKNLKGSDGQPLTFVKSDLIDLLKINDMAPGFVEKIAAISYRPLGIRQIARAYETNTITENDAKGYYQDLGYDIENAKTIAAYLTVDSAERRAKFLGRPQPSELEKAYINGYLSEEQYTDELLNAGLPYDNVSERVRHAKTKAIIADNQVKVTAARKRFLQGYTNRQEYLDKLLSIGLDNDRANEIVQRDDEVKQAKNKEIAVGKLCTLVKQGLLAPADYFTRAMNLGYTLENASLLVQSCMVEYQEALQRKVEAAIKTEAALQAKQAAKADKVRKELEKAAKENQPCRPRPKPYCNGKQS